MNSVASKLELTLLAPHAQTGAPTAREITVISHTGDDEGSTLASALSEDHFFSALEIDVEGLQLNDVPLNRARFGRWPLVNGAVLNSPRYALPGHAPLLGLLAMDGQWTGTFIALAEGRTPISNIDPSYTGATTDFLESTQHELIHDTGTRQALRQSDTLTLGSTQWRVVYAVGPDPLRGSASNSALDYNSGNSKRDRFGQNQAEITAGELLSRGLENKPLPAPPTGSARIVLGPGQSVPLRRGLGLGFVGQHRFDALNAVLVQLIWLQQPCLIYGQPADLPRHARFFSQFRLAAPMDVAADDEVAISVSARLGEQDAVIVAWGAMENFTVLDPETNTALTLVSEANFERFARHFAPPTLPADMHSLPNLRQATSYSDAANGAQLRVVPWP